MNHLSNYVKNKEFINVDVIEPGKASVHSKYGTRPDTLYLTLEPYNRELLKYYQDSLVDLIIKKKNTIARKFKVKRIVIDDLLTIIPFV